MTSGQRTPPPIAASSSFSPAGFSARPTVAAFSGRGFDMLRLINPPPLAANNSQVFIFNFLSLHHVSHCRSQDYRPPFPQQGVNQSLLERNSSSAAPPPQFILSHKVSPGPSWDSPVTPSTPTCDTCWQLHLVSDHLSRTHSAPLPLPSHCAEHLLSIPCPANREEDFLQPAFRRTSDQNSVVSSSAAVFDKVISVFLHPMPLERRSSFYKMSRPSLESWTCKR